MPLAEQFKLLQNILQELSRSEYGLSTSEIADSYNIDRKTALKYINILTQSGIPIYEERQRYYLDSSYRVSLNLSVEEQELLYVALEWIGKHHIEQWGIVRQILGKIGTYMRADVAEILLHERHTQNLQPDAEVNFKLLSQARHNHQEVIVEYRPLHQLYTTQWRIRPYLLTHNELSDGLYVVCDGKLGFKDYIPLTLKLNRIIKIELTKERFTPLSPEVIVNRLETSWGVWQQNQESPIRIVLRFEPRHYPRLQESIWHPSQKITLDSQGYVIVSFDIAQPREIVPWIRSWGSGVVVLEPPSLREQILRTLRRQMQQYGLDIQSSSSQNNALSLLWAKYDRQSSDYHLLLYHMLDVAAVAYLLYEEILSDSQRTWLTNLMGGDAIQTRQWILFWVALHDIGKASSDFQRKAMPIYKELLLTCGLEDSKDFRTKHGEVSSAILKRKFLESGGRYELPRELAIPLALAIGGHHGTWITNQSANNIHFSGSWVAIQDQLIDILADFFGIAPLDLQLTKQDAHLLTVFLSGFTSVVDWLGSMETYFPFERNVGDIAMYWEYAQSQARSALEETGWYSRQSNIQTLTFEETFGFKPNAFQKQIIASKHLMQSTPRAIIVEYMTGGGKTEAAFHLADLIINDLSLAGLYVAMPTQATSNQIFGRLASFLQTRFPKRNINLQLLHGQADYHPLFELLTTTRTSEGNENGLVAESWFQNKKRALLSPYAVGTIDQAMLSVLQARHHFVRQYALSHKVVIFDEIHAYDTYMSNIIQRLIHWLYGLQSPMILLSATLPKRVRNDILAQYQIDPLSVDDMPYPRVTFIGDDYAKVVQLPVPNSRQIQLEQIGHNIKTLVDYLVPIYLQGGCIAVICNTVDESIRIAQALRQDRQIRTDEVMLFHARYPQTWRQEIEQTVLARFSKTGERPKRFILVATQIIEQSLDLDFDLIVTSTGPVDLLIQRVGRLHRHERSRPQHLGEPRLIIRRPTFDEQGIPAFGNDEYVYARFILLKTWLLLSKISAFELPKQMDEYIEFVYGDAFMVEDVSHIYSEALQRAKDKMEKEERSDIYNSSELLVGKIDDSFLFGKNSFDLPDDGDELRLNINTRAIRPSVDIICVHDFQGQLSLSPDSLIPIEVNQIPDKQLVRKLLQHRLSIQRFKLKEAIEKIATIGAWQPIRALRFARLLVFKEGVCRIYDSSYVLRLTRDNGLEIEEVN